MRVKFLSWLWSSRRRQGGSSVRARSLAVCGWHSSPHQATLESLGQHDTALFPIRSKANSRWLHVNPRSRRAASFSSLHPISNSISSSLIPSRPSLPRPSFTFLQATLVNRSLSYGTISLLRLLQSTFSIHSSPPFHHHVPSLQDLLRFIASTFRTTTIQFPARSATPLHPHLSHLLIQSIFLSIPHFCRVFDTTSTHTDYYSLHIRYPVATCT